MEQNIISDTHEWRNLEDFQEGDTIHRWGYDLPVVKVVHSDVSIIHLYYQNTDGEQKVIADHETAQYIAHKR